MLRPKLAALIFGFSLTPCLACASPEPAADTGVSAESGTDGSEAETTAGQTETGTADTTDTQTGDTTAPDPCMVDMPIVVLETTLGTMAVQLDRVHAPITVANFITYVEMSFYDGTIFHRVIDGFVIQGGGYEPGLVLKPTLGPIPLEIDPALRHVDGAIAMARSAMPNTAESQFYITDGAQPGLDDMYAVFGVLIDGFPVRNAISAVPVQSSMGLDDVPVTDVLVESAYCVESWP